MVQEVKHDPDRKCKTGVRPGVVKRALEATVDAKGRTACWLLEGAREPQFWLIATFLGNRLLTSSGSETANATCLHLKDESTSGPCVQSLLCLIGEDS